MAIYLNRRIVGMAFFAAAAFLATSVHAKAPAGTVVSVSHVTGSVAVSAQIEPDQLADIKARGYTTVISMRPDGESPDQPSAALMNHAAQSNGIAFAYVPVVPGAIPDTAVRALKAALERAPGKVLLYCRSGSRAARTWALVEASRSDGASPEAIISMIHASGHSVDGLRDDIIERAAHRRTTD